MDNLAAQMPFAAHLNIQVTDASADAVQGTMFLKPEYCTVGGAAHGGAIMTFADSLGAVGGYLSLPEGASGTTTIESKINLVGRANEGATITGHSTPVSIGRRLSVWQTRVTDESDRLVALVTQTQLVL